MKKIKWGANGPHLIACLADKNIEEVAILRISADFHNRFANLNADIFI